MVLAGFAVNLWRFHVSVRAGKVGLRRAGKAGLRRIVDRALVGGNLQALVVRSYDARHGSASKACRGDGGCGLLGAGVG